MRGAKRASPQRAGCLKCESVMRRRSQNFGVMRGLDPRIHDEAPRIQTYCLASGFPAKAGIQR
jgi:hypothetical protein